MPKGESNYTRRKRRTRAALRRVNRAALPRLSVYRSNRNITAQLIDDVKMVTLAHASTVDPEIRETLKSGATTDAAAAIGKLLAERAKKIGVEKIQFDRGGFLYHGRIKAVADGAREGGLQF